MSDCQKFVFDRRKVKYSGSAKSWPMTSSDREEVSTFLVWHLWLINWILLSQFAKSLDRNACMKVGSNYQASTHQTSTWAETRCTKQARSASTTKTKEAIYTYISTQKNLNILNFHYYLSSQLNYFIRIIPNVLQYDILLLINN